MFLKDRQVSSFGCFVFEIWVLRFRVLGASCFGLRFLNYHQNSVKLKTTGNRCTVTDRPYELKKNLKKTSKEILVLNDILARYSS